MQCQGQIQKPTGHALRQPSGKVQGNLGDTSLRVLPSSTDALKGGPLPSGRGMAGEGLQADQKKQLLTGKAAHSNPA